VVGGLGGVKAREFDVLDGLSGLGLVHLHILSWTAAFRENAASFIDEGYIVAFIVHCNIFVATQYIWTLGY